jgi:hypothetical protein
MTMLGRVHACTLGVINAMRQPHPGRLGAFRHVFGTALLPKLAP